MITSTLREIQEQIFQFKFEDNLHASISMKRAYKTIVEKSHACKCTMSMCNAFCECKNRGVLCTLNCPCKGQCHKLAQSKNTNKTGRRTCRCKKKCGPRCGCRKKNMKCTETCACEGFCYNNISDKVDKMLGLKDEINDNDTDLSPDLSVLLGLVPSNIHTTSKTDMSQLTSAEATKKTNE